MSSWTYDPALLLQNPPSQLMQVRRLLGDTQAVDQQLFDEEILWFISLHTNIYAATAEAAQSIAFQLARQVDVVQGELKTNYSNRSKQYYMLSRYMRQLGLRGALPYAGAVSIADKINVQGDTDRPPPDFQRGQFDDRLPVDPAGEQTQSFSLPDTVGPDSDLI